jgi:arylsulfatase A-like enzyme
MNGSEKQFSFTRVASSTSGRKKSKVLSLKAQTVLTALGAATLALAVFSCSTRAAAAAPKPNIVFILADDLGYGELSCQGFTHQIHTPNIDSIAKNGVRFTSGYVTAPFCAASRASLLTGRYQTRFGFEFNPIGPKNAAPGIGLPLAEKTVAVRLRDAGYVTGLVGKWHLGGTAEFHPQRHGFDEFFGFLHEGHYYVPPPWPGVTTWLRRKTLPDGNQGRWTAPDGRIVWSTHIGSNEPEYDADNPLLRNSQPADEKANLTDAFTREACDFIGRHRAQPFFLYLAYNAVHSPLQGADAYMKKFVHIEDIQRRIFAAMLTHLDDGVGKVLAQLRASGVEENTLVVFLSDNGGPTKELTSSNAPLRGGKGELWDGGVRVPFIVSWKDRIPAGRTIDAPVTSMDATATALELAGAGSDQTRLDGVSLIPLLTGKTTEVTERTLFWRVGRKNALRSGDWKLIRDGKEWQLYDLAHDIGETTDLAAKEPARVQQMSSLWDKWNSEQIEPLWR